METRLSYSSLLREENECILRSLIPFLEALAGPNSLKDVSVVLVFQRFVERLRELEGLTHLTSPPLFGHGLQQV